MAAVTRGIEYLGAALAVLFGARCLVDGPRVTAQLGLRPLGGASPGAAWRAMTGARNLAFGVALAVAARRGDHSAAGYLLAGMSAMEAGNFAVVLAYGSPPARSALVAAPIAALVWGVGARLS